MALHFERIGKYMDYYWQGLKMTGMITAVTLLFCIVVTAIIICFRVSRFKVLNAIAAFYTSFFRGVPVVVQLFVIYFGSAAFTGNKVALPAVTASIITFVLNSSAYYAENIRGGILGVDKGQMEAAKALGLGYTKGMIFIVLPQAFRSVMPALINTTITLLKNTSVVSQIGVLDIMRSGQMVMNVTYLYFEPLIIVALVYLTIILLITIVGKTAEGYLNRAVA